MLWNCDPLKEEKEQKENANSIESCESTELLLRGWIVNTSHLVH